MTRLGRADTYSWISPIIGVVDCCCLSAPQLLLSFTTPDRPRADDMDLRTLENELYDAHAKWYALGVQLGVSTCRLDAIRVDHNYRCAADCQREMLEDWRNNAVECTWEKVAEALESGPVAMARLARSVREKHCGMEAASPSVQRPRGIYVVVRASLAL